MRKTDIYIAITTYNRPKELQELLGDVARETEGKNYHVRVYDDHSDVPAYAPFDMVRYAKNHGKQRYWQIINDVFKDAETWDFKYFFLLQDDCRLVEGFFDKAIAEFEAISDPRKATFCPFTPITVYDRMMWSRKKAKDVEQIDGKTYILGNYVDCIFMCPRETLNILRFRVDPISPERFKNNKYISSGVGQQLTERLTRISKTLWVAWSSLIIAHCNESKMNQEERAKNPLSPLIRERKTQTFKLYDVLKSSLSPNDRIIAGMASIKSREITLEQTVNSLIHQVDELHIYLNDYEKVPKFLQNNPKIKFYMGKVYRDRGDVGKFFKVQEVEGYYFSCDDDLIYPPDYVEKTVSFLKSKQNSVIATYHGAVLKSGKLHDYYRDRRQVHYSAFQRHEMAVHIGGTGVMAFHTSVFKPHLSDFKHPNMADIWVGLLAQDQKIPILSAPRQLHWIKTQEIPTSETIYGSKKNHGLQTQIINEWKEINGEFK